MELKYFRYISQTKVDMLYDQLTSKRVGSFQFSPKISLPGFQIEVGLRSDAKQNEQLVSRTTKLLSMLHKRKLVHSMSGDGDLSLENLYKDIGVWHTGLYKWKIQEVDDERPESFDEILAYFAFRTFGDSLILLIGSPTHVMGGVGANKERNIPFETTEYMFDIELRKRVRRLVKADAESSNLPKLLLDDDEYTLSLGVFCLGTLTSLPSAPTETIFKLFEYRKLEKDTEWFFFDKADRLGLFDLSRIYVGSPIYTART